MIGDVVMVGGFGGVVSGEVGRVGEMGVGRSPCGGAVALGTALGGALVIIGRGGDVERAIGIGRGLLTSRNKI